MRLLELLEESLVKVELRAETREQAIDELIDLLVAQGVITGEEQPRVRKAIFDREHARSTGMEHGVALPHGAVEGLDHVAAALGIARAGIDWAALDGRPTHLVILLAIPENMLQSHVKTLAGIARLLNDEGLRDALRRAKTPGEAVSIIESGEEGL
jgi:mannitol/fructose-specific phosphotransferase system IIA component (Ntr-type)